MNKDKIYGMLDSLGNDIGILDRQLQDLKEINERTCKIYRELREELECLRKEFEQQTETESSR